MNNNLILGTETNNVRDAKEILQIAQLNSQDFVVIPLFHPRNRRSHEIEDKGMITRSDMVLESNMWIANVVGKISEWIDLDNSSVSIRRKSEEALKQEYAWACHLGLQAIVFPMPAPSSPNYGKCLQQLCNPLNYQQIWVKIPLVYPLDYRNNGQIIDGWNVWNQLRHFTGHKKQIYIALEFSDDFPYDDETTLYNSFQRWRGEPIKAIVLHTSIFLTNQKQFPVLSKRHQHLLKILMNSKVHVILKGRSLHCGGTSLVPYFQYLRHLQSIARSEYSSQLTSGELSCDSYNDILQAPLQPLMDNLESQIYETFEKDPVKYANYQAAIAKALHAMIQRLSTEKGGMENGNEDGSVEAQNDDEFIVDKQSMNFCPSPIVVMVVGAGRGPLVAAALSASFETNIPIKVYAVEKNRNAIVTLRNRCHQESWDNVEVIAIDMRKWNPPVKADIMVSELLGSWGDNELSPECLDGAQEYLHSYGISIPESYTSYVSPITSSKLWNSACDIFPADRLKGLETPYVVRLHSFSELCPPQPLFSFSHPNFDKPIDNTRYGTLSFVSPYDQCIHGFCGTFDSILYDDVTISIAPHSYSKGMFSWFPLFIPLLTPITIQSGQQITIHIWRCSDDHRVWYEWCLSSPITTPIQNPNGRSYWIGL